MLEAKVVPSRGSGEEETEQGRLGLQDPKMDTASHVVYFPISNNKSRACPGGIRLLIFVMAQSGILLNPTHYLPLGHLITTACIYCLQPKVS